MTRKCIVSECQSAGNDLFPSPCDSHALNKWKTLLDVNENEFFVCSLHFDDRFIETRKVLRDEAYPSNRLAQSGDESCCECCCRSISSKDMKVEANERLKEIIRNLLDLEVS